MDLSLFSTLFAGSVKALLFVVLRITVSEVQAVIVLGVLATAAAIAAFLASPKSFPNLQEKVRSVAHVIAYVAGIGALLLFVGSCFFTFMFLSIPTGG